jgi:hypothetical protein
MKTITALMMAIFLAMGMSTTAMAGDDGVSARKARNAEMLTNELEPYGQDVQTNNISAKRVDNLYMLLGELEPYGEGVHKQAASVKGKKGMSPKKYNNLCMVCDEID